MAATDDFSLENKPGQDKNRKTELNWPKMFNIIEGIAQGLLYLHKYLRMQIIYKDLKANKILLEGTINLKILIFGMARIFKENETEAMTNKVVETYGYMSLEYAMEGTLSIKSDIFSFGVLILEIVSGRRNTIHGVDGGLSTLMGACLKRDVWDGIISCGSAIDDLRISFRNSLCPKIGNGEEILFWKDEWFPKGKFNLNVWITNPSSICPMVDDVVYVGIW
ncbi:G-type lectin S-receptor-like serine/threonine-protein kinase [Tanacetum coccineum]